LRDVLVRVTHPNVNEDLRHQLFIEVRRSESPEGMKAAERFSHLHEYWVKRSPQQI
jgi:hypothetical protein